MTEGGTEASFRRSSLRAPKDHGGVLQVPPLHKAGTLLANNQRRFASASNILIGDSSLAELRRDAQRELIELATRYVATYQSELVQFESPAGIMLTGHQPELYHPGVWFKNFALSSVASDLNLAAVNLIIDTEACLSASVDVPSGSPDKPQVVKVSFDETPSGLPYELADIVDESRFRNFPDEVKSCLKGFDFEPSLCDSLWKHVLRATEFSRNKGYCLSAGRHMLEYKLGLRTLELPLSKVCQTRSFAIFSAHILHNLKRFIEIYNEALKGYRTENHLRSKTHPAPDLHVGTDGEAIRLEAPFWVWNKNDSMRRPLFVTQSNSQRMIDETHTVATENVSQLAQDIHSINAVSTTSIRSKAFLTTMYARLILGDLFIHGIGGAKYDAVTNKIITDFFGIEPPDFVTVTATCHLPVAKSETTEDQLKTIDKQLREIQFHPERFVDQLSGDSKREMIQAEAERLMKEKQRLFQAEAEPSERKKRHQEIEQLNASLRKMVEPVETSLLAEKRRIESELSAKNILSSREYAFCLFPETLTETLSLACRRDSSLTQ